MESVPANVTFGRCFLCLFKTTCAIKKYSAEKKKKNQHYHEKYLPPRESCLREHLSKLLGPGTCAF